MSPWSNEYELELLNGEIPSPSLRKLEGQLVKLLMLIVECIMVVEFHLFI